MFKKSYEISYALWRMAAIISQAGFAGILYRNASELIDLAATNKYREIAAKIPEIETVIKFGIDVDAVSLANGDVILRELEWLKSAIETHNGKIAELDIAGIFAGKDVPATPDVASVSKPVAPTGFIPLRDEEEPAPINLPVSAAVSAEAGEVGNFPRAEARQSAIAEKIRQMGACRLADIQAVLPDVSERTIRYDLETLVQRNLIERVGTGGRSVYYRAR